jgi:hypothetical protein
MLGEIEIALAARAEIAPDVVRQIVERRNAAAKPSLRKAHDFVAIEPAHLGIAPGLRAADEDQPILALGLGESLLRVRQKLDLRLRRAKAQGKAHGRLIRHPHYLARNNWRPVPIGKGYADAPSKPLESKAPGQGG